MSANLGRQAAWRPDLPANLVATALEQYGDINGFVSVAGAEIENVRSCGLGTPDGLVDVSRHRMLKRLPTQRGG